jgi:CrcB protein
MIQTYLAVMAGGAVGTGIRMYITMWMAAQYGENFPWGTILVNIVGCFVIGLFSGLTGPDGLFLTSPLVRLVVMVGVLGGFTTFSSFSLQTLALLSDGKWLDASANVLVSVIFCLLATWGGLLLAGCWQPTKI